LPVNQCLFILLSVCRCTWLCHLVGLGAIAGFYCPQGSVVGDGVACPAGSWCAAAAMALPSKCTSALGFACQGGASSAEGTICPQGDTPRTYACMPVCVSTYHDPMQNQEIKRLLKICRPILCRSGYAPRSVSSRRRQLLSSRLALSIRHRVSFRFLLRRRLGGCTGLYGHAR